MTAAVDFEATTAELIERWQRTGMSGAEFEASIALALREAGARGAAAEREAIISKLCREHVHEDDLIAWIRARGLSPSPLPGDHDKTK